MKKLLIALLLLPLVTSAQQFVPNLRTTNATSTNFHISNNLSFNGVVSNVWSDFCVAITGGTGLCDGIDSVGVSLNPNSKWATSTASDITPNGGGGIIVSASSTLLNFIFSQATGTRATTTSLFSTTASSTNLFSTAFNLGNGVWGNATGSSATTSSFFANTASSTNLFTTIGNALALGDSAGKLTSYTGTSCTNQFVRSLSAIGAASCATVGATDVSLANLSATDATLTFSGTYNGSTARSIGLTLSNGNVWTAASSTYAGGLTILTSTTTSATTTNLFSTTASSTNLFSSLLTVGTNALIVNSSGNVGIGVSPTQKLQVNGNIIIPNNTFAYQIFDAQGNARDTIFMDSANNVQFKSNGTGGIITFNTATLERLRIDNTGGILVSAASTTLQNFTFNKATGTSATSTNLFSTTASTSALYLGLGACDTLDTNAAGQVICGTDAQGAGGGVPNSKWATSTDNVSIAPNGGGGIIVSASSTIDRLSSRLGTTTYATSTNLFATTASSTNLFSTSINTGNITSGTLNSQTISSAASFTGTLNVTSGLTSLSNLLMSGSSTLLNFTALNSTSTNATTTSFFASTASSTKLFATNATTSTLNVGTNALQVLSNAFVGVSTSSPYCFLCVVGDGVNSIFAAATSTANVSSAPVFEVDKVGHLRVGGKAPSVAAACGTNPSVSGNDTAGTITTGTGGPTSCKLTFANTFTTAPVCVITPDVPANTKPFGIQSSSTATFLNVMASSSSPFVGMTSWKIYYQCLGIN